MPPHCRRSIQPKIAPNDREKALIGVIKQLEWWELDGEHPPICLCCYQRDMNGHKPDCDLALALEPYEDQKETK